MTTAVTPLAQLFDAEKIKASIPDHIWSSNEFQNTHKQLSITHSMGNDSLYDSVGLLLDRHTGEVLRDTADFSILNAVFANTYLAEVVDAVRKQAEADGVTMGRVRILLLKPKTCYSLHQDPEEFRYHIPITTSTRCFFVSGDVVERMGEVGRLYRFNTKDFHTAVNASFEITRYHLVFDTV